MKKAVFSGKSLAAKSHAATACDGPGGRDGTAPVDPEPPYAILDGDTYQEGGTVVFTAKFHLRRGYCCGNGCRHCPYK